MKLAFNNLFGEFVSNIGNTLTFTGYGTVEDGEDWLTLRSDTTPFESIYDPKTKKLKINIPRKTDTTVSGIYLTAKLDRSNPEAIPAVLIYEEGSVVNLSAGNNLFTLKFPDEIGNYDFNVKNVKSTLDNADDVVREGFGSDPGQSIYTADSESKTEIITKDSFLRSVIVTTSDQDMGGLNTYGEDTTGRGVLKVYTNYEIALPGMKEDGTPETDYDQTVWGLCSDYGLDTNTDMLWDNTEDIKVSGPKDLQLTGKATYDEYLVDSNYKILKKLSTGNTEALSEISTGFTISFTETDGKEFIAYQINDDTKVFTYYSYVEVWGKRQAISEGILDSELKTLVVTPIYNGSGEIVRYQLEDDIARLNANKIRLVKHNIVDYWLDTSSLKTYGEENEAGLVFDSKKGDKITLPFYFKYFGPTGKYDTNRLTLIFKPFRKSDNAAIEDIHTFFDCPDSDLWWEDYYEDDTEIEEWTEEDPVTITHKEYRYVVDKFVPVPGEENLYKAEIPLQTVQENVMDSYYPYFEVPETDLLESYVCQWKVTLADIIYENDDYSEALAENYCEYGEKEVTFLTGQKGKRNDVTVYYLGEDESDQGRRAATYILSFMRETDGTYYYNLRFTIPKTEIGEKYFKPIPGVNDLLYFYPQFNNIVGTDCVNMEDHTIEGMKTLVELDGELGYIVDLLDYDTEDEIPILANHLYYFNIQPKEDAELDTDSGVLTSIRIHRKLEPTAESGLSDFEIDCYSINNKDRSYSANFRANWVVYYENSTKHGTDYTINSERSNPVYVFPAIVPPVEENVGYLMAQMPIKDTIFPNTEDLNAEGSPILSLDIPTEVKEIFDITVAPFWNTTWEVDGQVAEKRITIKLKDGANNEESTWRPRTPNSEPYTVTLVCKAIVEGVSKKYTYQFYIVQKHVDDFYIGLDAYGFNEEGEVDKAGYVLFDDDLYNSWPSTAVSKPTEVGNPPGYSSWKVLSHPEGVELCTHMGSPVTDGILGLCPTVDDVPGSLYYFKVNEAYRNKYLRTYKLGNVLIARIYTEPAASVPDWRREVDSYNLDGPSILPVYRGRVINEITINPISTAYSPDGASYSPRLFLLTYSKNSRVEIQIQVSTIDDPEWDVDTAVSWSLEGLHDSLIAELKKPGESESAWVKKGNIYEATLVIRPSSTNNSGYPIPAGIMQSISEGTGYTTLKVRVNSPVKVVSKTYRFYVVQGFFGFSTKVYVSSYPYSNVSEYIEMKPGSTVYLAGERQWKYFVFGYSPEIKQYQVFPGDDSCYVTVNDPTYFTFNYKTGQSKFEDIPVVTKPDHLNVPYDRPIALKYEYDKSSRDGVEPTTTLTISRAKPKSDLEWVNKMYSTISSTSINIIITGSEAGWVNSSDPVTFTGDSIIGSYWVSSNVTTTLTITREPSFSGKLFFPTSSTSDVLSDGDRTTMTIYTDSRKETVLLGIGNTPVRMDDEPLLIGHVTARTGGNDPVSHVTDVYLGRVVGNADVTYPTESFNFFNGVVETKDLIVKSYAGLTSQTINPDGEASESHLSFTRYSQYVFPNDRSQIRWAVSRTEDSSAIRSMFPAKYLGYCEIKNSTNSEIGQEYPTSRRYWYEIPSWKKSINIALNPDNESVFPVKLMRSTPTSSTYVKTVSIEVPSEMVNDRLITFLRVDLTPETIESFKEIGVEILIPDAYRTIMPSQWVHRSNGMAYADISIFSPNHNTLENVGNYSLIGTVGVVISPYYDDSNQPSDATGDKYTWNELFMTGTDRRGQAAPSDISFLEQTTKWETDYGDMWRKTKDLFGTVTYTIQVYQEGYAENTMTIYASPSEIPVSNTAANIILSSSTIPSYDRLTSWTGTVTESYPSGDNLGVITLVDDGSSTLQYTWQAGPIPARQLPSDSYYNVTKDSEFGWAADRTLTYKIAGVSSTNRFNGAVSVTRKGYNTAIVFRVEGSETTYLCINGGTYHIDVPYSSSETRLLIGVFGFNSNGTIKDGSGYLYMDNFETITTDYDRPEGVRITPGGNVMMFDESEVTYNMTISYGVNTGAAIHQYGVNVFCNEEGTSNRLAGIKLEIKQGVYKPTVTFDPDAYEDCQYYEANGNAKNLIRLRTNYLDSQIRLEGKLLESYELVEQGSYYIDYRLKLKPNLTREAWIGDYQGYNTIYVVDVGAGSLENFNVFQDAFAVSIYDPYGNEFYWDWDDAAEDYRFYPTGALRPKEDEDEPYGLPAEHYLDYSDYLPDYSAKIFTVAANRWQHYVKENDEWDIKDYTNDEKLHNIQVTISDVHFTAWDDDEIDPTEGKMHNFGTDAPPMFVQNNNQFALCYLTYEANYSDVIDFKANLTLTLSAIGVEGPAVDVQIPPTYILYRKLGLVQTELVRDNGASSTITTLDGTTYHWVYQTYDYFDEVDSINTRYSNGYYVSIGEDSPDANSNCWQADLTTHTLVYKYNFTMTDHYHESEISLLSDDTYHKVYYPTNSVWCAFGKASSGYTENQFKVHTYGDKYEVKATSPIIYRRCYSAMLIFKFDDLPGIIGFLGAGTTTYTVGSTSCIVFTNQETITVPASTSSLKFFAVEAPFDSDGVLANDGVAPCILCEGGAYPAGVPYPTSGTSSISISSTYGSFDCVDPEETVSNIEVTLLDPDVNTYILNFYGSTHQHGLTIFIQREPAPEEEGE